MTPTRFTLLALSSVLSTMLLSGCNDDTSVSLGDPIPVVPVKTFKPLCDPSATSQTIRFIHVADLHGHFGYREQFYSKIKKAYNDAYKEEPYTLFTNGGDDYEKGTVAEQISRGQATLEATKALDFDYRVVGNHDFAWGPEQLLEYARDDETTVLASNTEYYGSDPEGFAAVDFAIAKVGCIKVGIFGMTSGPWNELDEEIKPQVDFIDDFRMRWDWNDRAREIIAAYSDQVDYMVMLSHLGHGTDVPLAQYVDGIDLVLGGHTHGAPQTTEINNTTVVLPDFNAKGYTDVTVTFDLATKIGTTQSTIPIEITESSPIDLATKDLIDEIMDDYAPDTYTEIAVSLKQPNKDDILDILHEALINFVPPSATSTDPINIRASFLDKDEIEDREIWEPGSLTQEDFHIAYPVERQPSNTPGFSALYRVNVSGEALKAMILHDSGLDYHGPDVEDIDLSSTYQVGLFKSAAWNPELFFNDTHYLKEDAVLVDEAWAVLDAYARARTASCKFIDTEEQLFDCDENAPNIATVWNFNDTDNIFAPEQNLASSLTLKDPLDAELDCSSASPLLRCGTTESLGIPAVPSTPDDTSASVIELGTLEAAITGSFELSTTLAANGDFADEDRLSNYTLVFDALWPELDAGSRKYRAIMDANPIGLAPDIFLSPDGEIGLSPNYSGTIAANTWYRIALVFYASKTGDVVYKLYIDGEYIDTMRYSQFGESWAMNREGMALFTDTEPGSSESGTVYLNSLMFAARPLTDNDIKKLGGAQETLNYVPSVRVLNQSVERAYENAPVDWANKWVKQRAKFFKQRPQ